MAKSYLFDKQPTKKAIINQSVNIHDLTFDELYENIQSHWQSKAQRLQARRWRKIKHQLL